jgi:small subunit ribosomal protein S2
MSENSFNFTMNDLLQAGVHFGHRKNFWNPKMAKYIYGTRNSIHIIDLQQTVPHLRNALKVLKDVASQNGKILFVGTKRQASEIISQAAERCGQFFVNYRWLGGMLTNWDTISASIKTLKKYEDLLSNQDVVLTKKERLDIDRKRIRLNNVLGGIRNMGGRPDILFVIDVHQEKLAIEEAKNLGIPIVAIVDTNSNPDNINHIIPGNDDARKAIELYAKLVSDAVLSGIQKSLVNSGVDVGSVDIPEFDLAISDFTGIEKKDDEDNKDDKKSKIVQVIKKKIEPDIAKKNVVKENSDSKDSLKNDTSTRIAEKKNIKKLSNNSKEEKKSLNESVLSEKRISSRKSLKPKSDKVAVKIKEV